MNIYQKLIEVRKSVPHLQKDATGFKYTYVSGAKVIGSLKNKMNELGLLLVPNIIKHSFTNEGKKYVVECTMAMVWVNAEKPEEKLEVPFACYGAQDDVSKAFGSALTYSERYFLLKFFNIATDNDDPDAFQGKTTTQQVIKPEVKVLSAQAKTVISKINEQKTLDELINCRDAFKETTKKLSNFDQSGVITSYKEAKTKLEESVK